MIEVRGVDWAVTRKLRAALRSVPENGRFVFGLRGHSNLEQLRRFAAAGVACPEFTVDFGEVQKWLRTGFAVYGRKAEHSQGKDIIIARPSRQGVVLEPNWPLYFEKRRDYWTREVSDVKEEWRIHIFDGHSIARGLKINDDNNQLGLIRNRGTGYHMTHKVDPPDGMRKMAKKAVKALGYDYGAVDLLRTTDDKFVVLEVNRAPAMDNYTREKYVAAIRGRFA